MRLKDLRRAESKARKEYDVARSKFHALRDELWNAVNKPEKMVGKCLCYQNYSEESVYLYIIDYNFSDHGSFYFKVIGLYFDGDNFYKIDTHYHEVFDFYSNILPKIHSYLSKEEFDLKYDEAQNYLNNLRNQ